MKKFIHILVGVALFTLLLLGATVSASAAEEAYPIWVAGVQVTASNAADVLGDGTVSYDHAAGELTLSGATIKDCHTANLFDENVCIGIYAETDLTVNCIGENVIDLYEHAQAHEGNIGADGVFSQRSLTLKGTGSLSVNVCEYGIMAMNAMTLKDITLSVGAFFGIGNMQGDITLSNVTFKTPQNYPEPDELLAVIYAYTSDIVIENSTIEAIGYMRPIMNLQGSISISGSSLKLVASTDAIDDISEMAAIGVGSYKDPIGTPDQSLVITNSHLDITSDMFGLVCGGGKLRMENVTGQLQLSGEVAYAVVAVGNLEVSGCDLDISAIANGNGGSLGLGGKKVTVEASELDIAFGGSEASFAIASDGNMNITESQIIINGNAECLVGIYSEKGNVSLTDCQVDMKVRGIGDAGLTAGVFTEAGVLTVSGGRLHIMATTHLSNPDVGCIYTTTQLPSEIVNADVLLQGNKVSLLAPDLTAYSSAYVTEASENLDGSEAEEYQKENIAAYQYFHIHPFYRVNFDGNGLGGSMATVSDLYGSFQLPVCEFVLPSGAFFLGWAYEKDGKVIETPEIDVFKNTTLYAIWEIPQNDDPLLPEHSHSFGTEWKYDGNYHWKECACGDKTLASAHVDSNANGGCDICGAAMSENDKDGLGAGAIVAIVLGSVAVVCGGGFALYWFVLKKKR